MTVTSTGTRVLRRCAELAEQANERLLAPLNAEEREQLMALMTRVYEA
ncbi:hypothetical protein [Actinosynnema sp. ALI-1.44]|nr:hypothetical protein [Actinosynnema sp. ALI-1.44]